VNILVVPGTTLIAREVCNSLANVKNIQLFGAGFSMEQSVKFPYVGFDYIDSWNDEESLDRLSEIIEARDINLVYLAHDSWILGLHDTNFINNTKIIKSSASSIITGSYKSLTYKALQNFFPTPRVFSNLNEVTSMPFFVKPDRGQGSVGARIISDSEEALEYIDETGAFSTEWVACEYLSGNEYTIDCFSDSRANLLFASARIRESIENGIATHTQVLPMHTSLEWAGKIGSHLNITGAWFFQVKEDREGNPKLMEVGLRIAGASGVTRLKGINLPLMNVFQNAGNKLQIINQQTFPRIGPFEVDFGFEYEEIYVDFDDTLIVKGKRNSKLITFLEKARTDGIKIILITRHSGNLIAALEHYELKDLFGGLIHLNLVELKSEYIETSKKFIYIDDSFKERLDVSLRFGSQVLTLDETVFER
jgi:carbamoyl-phosphate synthase large subunit